MDWQNTEMQEAVAELAGQVLAGDGDPWAALVEAELTELDGLLEICTLLESVGWHGGHAPVLPSLVLGAPIRRAGLDVLPGEILTAGLLEEGCRDPHHNNTRVESGLLYGRKICVPAADRASRMVVPTDDGLWAVRLEDCRVSSQTGTDGDLLGVVDLDGAPGARIGGPELLDPWLQRVHLGIAALQLGMAKRALAMTADYVRERQQFGKPIGSFQAVSQRAADAWIDTRCMEVTLMQAAWRLSERLPAEREVRIARWWASEGGHRVVTAAQHLHGGTGFDRDYPLYRYFLCFKQWEFLLGGAEAQLAALGDVLAAERA